MAPRLGDAAFRAQRNAVEHAEAALRKLAAQAHGEVLTELFKAWENRDAASLPAAQALGGRVNAATRSAWNQSLSGAATALPPETLLRLEIAAEVPTPADHLSARRMLQLQLLTRRNDPAPAETWAQDVAKVLGSGFDAAAAKRLQTVLKVLLKR
jgi:ATP-dependent RNA helicase SUPV3L1/SUV3